MGEHPALWPLSLLVVFFPLVWLVTHRSPALSALIIRRRVRWLGTMGIVGVTLFCGCTLIYLHCAAFWDFFECREASVAAVLRQGGTVYPSLTSPERYCSPYGPGLYLTLAASQAVFGASVFATKLPATLANFLTLTLFWRTVRRQYGSRTAAWALTGLLAAFLMALRQLPFWAKADPLVLCVVTTGLYAAFRPGWCWCALMSVCAGMAVDLKPHALAYFLPALVVAWQTGWRVRQYLVWGGLAVLVTVLPYVAAPKIFPVENYLAYLVLTAREGVGQREIFGFCRWILLLSGFVVAFNRLTMHPRPLTPKEAGLRRAYYAALGVAVGLVAWPASSVGRGSASSLAADPIFFACGRGSILGDVARPLAVRTESGLDCLGLRHRVDLCVRGRANHRTDGAFPPAESPGCLGMHRGRRRLACQIRRLHRVERQRQRSWSCGGV